MSGASAGPGTRNLSTPQDVGAALRAVHDERTPVQVRFDGHPATYTTNLLEVDLGDRSFVLDKLNPGGGHALMAKPTTFALSARCPGLFLYSASNVVSRVEAERGLPFYRVPFPDSLLFQQRRTAVRAPVNHVLEATGHFTLASTGQALAGRLVDISLGGLRVEFDGGYGSLLDDDAELREGHVPLPDDTVLRFGARARHSHYVAERDITLCGIEFTDMDIRHRRLLQALVERLTRAQRKAQGSTGG